MKIKTKLVISFCITMFVPIFLVSVSIWSFGRAQLKQIEHTYGIKNAETTDLANSAQLLDHYTESDFQKLIQTAQQSPELFLDSSYVSECNKSLQDKSSYLIVRENDIITYNGSQDNDSLIQLLPDFGLEGEEYKVNTYIDSSLKVLVKQLDFSFSDGDEGSVFIVTTTAQMVPEVRNLLSELVIAVFIILILTAVLLMIWIYRSMITPIKQLQEAADRIKEGNLDFKIEVSGEDEIGRLGVSFEEMRKRLRDNATEKLSTEAESRVLISNIAHDLKTPITAVKGYAEGIIDGVANTPEKVDKYVRTIYNKANEMDTLINELTLYSKIDTNRIPYNFAKINVSEYFQDCIEEIGLDLESKGIGLGYYNYVDSDVMIIADPEQLRRVINNIISNSIKYMNKTKGFINIRIKDVGDFIQVEMEDNGRGIAQRDIPYIFDRFYRADASRNSVTGGSGIGLSIVKKIIEDHGGKIWATSKEDTGTTMYFVIRKYEEVYNEQDINC